MSHILGTLGWGSGPKTSDSPASVAVLVSIHPAALMTWRLMPAAFPDWSCMLVALQFWGVGVLLHFYGSLGVSLVGTLHGTPASMGLLGIPLVGTLCGGSTLVTSLCLDPPGYSQHLLKSRLKPPCHHSSCTLHPCRISTTWTLPRFMACIFHICKLSDS